MEVQVPVEATEEHTAVNCFGHIRRLWYQDEDNYL